MTTSTTTTKSKAKGKSKDLAEAEVLMTRYARLNQSRKDLLDTIMDQLKGYENEMKETEKKLIEIGERNKPAFDGDGNLDLGDGYLHIARNAKVITGKKFDLAEFHAARPEMVDVTLKLNPIKKAFLDKEQRKELVALGVQIDTVDKVQVILNKNI